MYENGFPCLIHNSFPNTAKKEACLHKNSSLSLGKLESHLIIMSWKDARIKPKSTIHRQWGKKREHQEPGEKDEDAGAH